uniref:Twitchin n=1 Tax=Megaselia scalaris TaxID=36166 RepID=T1GK41_MEGSC
EGKDYHFRVKAVNAEGESEPLETSQATTAKNPYDPTTAPGKPEVRDWSKNHADLKWKAPEKDGGAPITGYIIEVKDDSSNKWHKCLETDTPKCEAKIPDLIEGTKYQFRVKAVNKAGPSKPSEPSDTMLAKDRFAAPKIDRTNMKDIQVKAGQHVRLDVKVSGEPPPSKKWYHNKKHLDPKDAENVQIDVEPYRIKLYIPITSRANSGTYVLKAENESGQDEATIEITVLDKPAPLDDGGAPIDYYIVEKMDTETGRWLPAGKSREPNAEIANLVPGQEYKFRVMAVNTHGESEPLECDDKIIAKNPFDEPGKPGTPEATDWDKDHVDLKWTPPKDDGGSPITGYVVEKREKGTDKWIKGAEVPAGPGQECKATVNNLDENTEYEFRVRAINAAGPGEPSDASQGVVTKPRKLAPKIDRRNIHTYNFKEGEPIYIDVKIIVIGEPPPSKEWVHKDCMIINTDRVKVTNENYLTKLRIIDAKRSDTGEYTLTVKNVNGTDKHTANVTVFDVPSPPEGPMRPEEVTKNAITLRWRPPRDNGVTDCSIRAENLIEGHDYSFRVRAVNKFGESLPLNTSQPITAKDPFGRPDKPGTPNLVDWDKDHVDLEWTPPRKDGGSPITGYIIEMKPKFGTWQKAIDVPADTTAATPYSRA